MIEYVDLVIDLAYGDSGKGAVAHSLAKSDNYNVVMRCQGGSNAGHTIIHDEKKIVTHLVPCGLMHNKISLIGSGCVINEKKFLEEVRYLQELGFDTSLIKIAKNAHVVLDSHIEEELSESKIGTTKQGIGPAYRDKYARKGVTADSIDSLKPYIVDLYDFLYDKNNKLKVLVEGAQGFYLDIDHGDYPYVTSSHTTVAGCLLNMLPHNKVRKVYGCIKAYETYVGSKKFQLDDEIFNELSLIGNEFGSTTGRRRQCNWINVDNLKKAINVNSVSHLVISKLDILETLNKKYDNKYWKVIEGDKINCFDSLGDFSEKLANIVISGTDSCNYIQYRNSPHETVFI